ALPSEQRPEAAPPIHRCAWVIRLLDPYVFGQLVGLDSVVHCLGNGLALGRRLSFRSRRAMASARRVLLIYIWRSALTGIRPGFSQRSRRRRTRARPGCWTSRSPLRHLLELPLSAAVLAISMIFGSR